MNKRDRAKELAGEYEKQRRPEDTARLAKRDAEIEGGGNGK